MDPREQRGIIIAATVKLAECHGVWVVPSQTGSDKRYMVDPRKGTCTCPDHQETGFKCKHLHAVEFTVRRELRPDGSVVEQRTFTWTEEKTTYPQPSWSAYNLAQGIEKHRLQVLLADLCRGLPEPERDATKPGPKPHRLADRVFACCFKVYGGLSSPLPGKRTGNRTALPSTTRKTSADAWDAFLSSSHQLPRRHETNGVRARPRGAPPAPRQVRCNQKGTGG
jgi:hypothetical protein